MSSIEAITHAQQVRRRLINPPNAVKDNPINLRAKRDVVIQLPPVAPVAPIQPEKTVINISEDSLDIPTDLPGMVKEIRRLQKHLGKLSTACVKMFVQISHKGPRGIEIIDAVAEHYGFTRLDIVSQRRPIALSDARHVSMYLCRHLTTLSLANIGRLYTDRDHSSVHHGVQKIERQRKTDMHLDASLTMLTERLSAK